MSLLLDTFFCVYRLGMNNVEISEKFLKPFYKVFIGQLRQCVWEGINMGTKDNIEMIKMGNQGNIEMINMGIKDNIKMTNMGNQGRIRKILASWIRIHKNLQIHRSASKLNGS